MTDEPVTEIDYDYIIKKICMYLEDPLGSSIWQRINKLSERVDDLEKSSRFDDVTIDQNFTNMSVFCKNIQERIEHLEQDNKLLKEQAHTHLQTPMRYPYEKKITDLEQAFNCFKNDKDSFLNLIGRIEHLESENEMRANTIGCLDTAYNDALLDFEKRLIKLEKLAHEHLPANAWRDEEIKPLLPTCQHEWETRILYASNPPKLKCKKCDEFSIGIDPAFIPTLQLCAHGSPVKFNNCAVCNLASE